MKERQYVTLRRDRLKFDQVPPVKNKDDFVQNLPLRASCRLFLMLITLPPYLFCQLFVYSCHCISGYFRFIHLRTDRKNQLDHEGKYDKINYFSDVITA